MGKHFMVGRPAVAESIYYNTANPLSTEGAKGSELHLTLEKIAKKCIESEITKGAT